MGLLCQCPPGAAPSNITILQCLESFGQIQKYVFQRTFDDSNAKNKFVIATANPNVKASWDTLLAASNSTKVVQTPFIQGPNNEPGGPRTYGGGNETLGGVEIITGREPTTFEAQFHDTSQRTIADIKTYQCEIASVYFVNEKGWIGGIVDDLTTPTEFMGIPIAVNTMFVGDKKFGMLTEPDMNAIRFQFLPNWSDKFYIIEPTDFDALTELVTP